MPAKFSCLTFALFAILFTTQADAQALNEYQRLTPDTLSGGDRFGHSIANNDNYIAASAPGLLQGEAVYIFNTSLGKQIHKLEATDSELGNWFGIMLAMSDTQLAVAESVTQGSDRIISSVSIFDLQTGMWLNKIKLNTHDPIQFGGPRAFVLSGDILAIGAPFDSDFSKFSGAVYLYDTITGALLHKLYPSDPSELGYDYFGYSLGIHEGTLAIEAPNGGGFGSSEVYLFDMSAGEVISIIPTGDDQDDSSGSISLDINDQYIAVGSFTDRVVYLYDRATGALIAELATQDGHDGKQEGNSDFFGFEIAIDGDLLLVAAPFDNQSYYWSGAAYLFDLSSESQIAKLLPAEGTYGGQFGSPLAFNDGQVVISEINNGDFGQSTGAVYLFDINYAHLCSPDFDDNGQLNTTDIELFINQYINNDPSADFAVDGLWNFYDISEFIKEFTTGCP